MIPVALLADNRLHAALRDDILLADIAGIKPQILPFVFLLYKRLDDIGVVDAGICGSVLLNKFRLLVGLHVVFVAVVPLAALLRLSGIGVLVGTLMGLALLLLCGVTVLCLPEILAVASLNLPVLLVSVVLVGSLDKGGIDNLALIERQPK